MEGMGNVRAIKLGDVARRWTAARLLPVYAVLRSSCGVLRSVTEGNLHGTPVERWIHSLENVVVEDKNRRRCDGINRI
jgi:hypothetical protein